MWLSTTHAPRRATTACACGSWESALMSFTIRAPASSASSITAARRVSTETRTPSSARARITGITRRSSSASLGACEPGRVDSPPTSMMSAPPAAMARPCATAPLSTAKSPPSEKLSGVTLRTPMRRGRSNVSPQTGPRGVARRALNAAISLATAGAFFSAQRESTACCSLIRRRAGVPRKSTSTRSKVSASPGTGLQGRK